MTGMADTAGRGELVRAFEAARAADDVATMADVARRLAADRVFGAPLASSGFVHEAYERAVAVGDDGLRATLAVELARSWAYAGEPDRAVPFARDAVDVAERIGDPAGLAAALDAELLTLWGPDHLDARVRAAARLDGLAGRLTDVEARLSAALWRLTTGLETLDVVAVRRQLRVLDDLARESGSPRVAMFSASRRGMYALVTGDLVTAAALVDEVRVAAGAADEPDGEALVHVLVSGVARQSGDVETLAREAAAYEGFAVGQGIRSVLAEAALFRLEAGDREHAAALLDQVVPEGGLAAVTRDVDWLLVAALATEVAVGVGALDVVRDGADALAPYAGRAVVNAGGVAFAGVVDDVLASACTALGRPDDAARHAGAAAAGYRRIGATWWARRRAAPAPAAFSQDRVVLAPVDGDVWLVGPQGRAVPVKAAKGFAYLRLLLARPGVPLTAFELSGAANGATAPPQADLGTTLDRRALAEYRRRLADLDSELDGSGDRADVARTERLTAERQFLLDEIAAATGLHGRARRTGGDEERARVAVRKALAAAVRRVEDVDPAVGRLLRDTVRTGATCCYEPDPARLVVWVLDPPAT